MRSVYHTQHARKHEGVRQASSRPAPSPPPNHCRRTLRSTLASPLQPCSPCLTAHPSTASRTVYSEGAPRRLESGRGRSGRWKPYALHTSERRRSGSPSNTRPQQQGQMGTRTVTTAWTPSRCLLCLAALRGPHAQKPGRHPLLETAATVARTGLSPT